MLKLLLDEHVSPRVADGLSGRHRAVQIHALVEWHNGRLLGQNDALCLREAAEHGLTLVTYDRRTIPPLIKIWTEEGRAHGGVIFVDEKTISPADVGGLVRALTALVRETKNWDWTNRIYYLRR